MNDQNIFITIIIGILLILSFAMAVIWFFMIAQKKIIGSQLKQKEMEIIFQKELLTNAVTIQEQERDRIAKELHDDIGSKLNIATLNIHLLQKKIPEDENSKLIFDRLNDSIKASAARTRKISHELMPPVFQNFGFVYALEELQNSINASGELKISLKYYQNVNIKDKIKLLHIYRIIQELISNTIKYANATIIDIAFKKDNDSIVMTYKDNGKGFDVNQKSSGMGFNNIRTRCELLRGSMDYESAIDNGFSITIKFLNHD